MEWGVTVVMEYDLYIACIIGVHHPGGNINALFDS